MVIIIKKSCSFKINKREREREYMLILQVLFVLSVEYSFFGELVKIGAYLIYLH